MKSLKYRLPCNTIWVTSHITLAFGVMILVHTDIRIRMTFNFITLMIGMTSHFTLMQTSIWSRLLEVRLGRLSWAPNTGHWFNFFDEPNTEPNSHVVLMVWILVSPPLLLTGQIGFDFFDEPNTEYFNSHYSGALNTGHWLQLLWWTEYWILGRLASTSLMNRILQIWIPYQ